MAEIITAPINYAVIAGGNFVSGGAVVFGVENVKPDAANPATLKSVYLDSTLLTEAQNPQPLNSSAVFNQAANGVLYGADNDKYSIVIYDRNGSELSYIPSYNLSDANAALDAQQSAADAMQSASDAAASEASTDALFTDFVNRYFGAFASDPTLDDKGNPPNEGSLYWNTGSARFKVYDSGAWIFPTDLALGTAAYADLGTDPAQVPTNADLPTFGTAAEADTGTDAGQVPTNENVPKHNYIVNSDMALSQEYGGSAVVAGSTQTYVVDQFSTSNTTGTGEITGDQTELDGRDAVRVTATGAVTDLSGSLNAGRIQQVLEVGHIKALNGKNITSSVKVHTNWSGKLSLALQNTTGKSFVTDLDVTAGQVVTIPYTLLLESNSISGANRDAGLFLIIGMNNEGSLQTVTTDEWVNGAFACSDQSTQWTKTLGNFVEITEVQLVEGTVAPDYQPFTDPIYNIYRYFERQEGVSTVQIGAGYAESSTEAQISLQYLPKRIPPPIIEASSSGALDVSKAGSTASGTGQLFSLKNETNCRCAITTSGLTAGQGVAGLIGAGEYIDINARLTI